MGSRLEAEVVVVGGGPAGLATAIAARLAGLDALVVERRRPPVDKACGEGLMPDGVEALRRLGVRLAPGDGAPFRGIRYLDEASVAAATFPGGPGLGIRRPVLHRALAARAEELGVRTLWGTAVRGLGGGGVETAGGPVRGRWIAGADGLRSQVRRWAGLGRRAPGHRRFGVRRHYRLPPWTDRVEVHWGAAGEAYVTPVGPDEVGVALLWSGAGGSFDALLEPFPRLRERLRGAPASSRDRGAGPFPQRARGVQRGRVALVGDAAGYLDALTGEGLAVAFHQAAALAAAMRAGDLRAYGRDHRRIMRIPLLTTRLLLRAEAAPALRRRLLSTFRRDPELFARALGIHVRAAPLRSLGVAGLLRLAAGLAARPWAREGGAGG